MTATAEITDEELAKFDPQQRDIARKIATVLRDLSFAARQRVITALMDRYGHSGFDAQKVPVSSIFEEARRLKILNSAEAEALAMTVTHATPIAQLPPLDLTRRFKPAIEQSLDDNLRLHARQMASAAPVNLPERLMATVELPESVDKFLNGQHVDHDTIEKVLARVLAHPDGTPEQREAIRAGAMAVQAGRLSKWNGLIGEARIGFAQPNRTPLERARIEIMELAESPKLTLGSVKESTAHQVVEAFSDNTMIYLTASEQSQRPNIGKGFSFESASVYLIQHDWAAALSTAEDWRDEGEYRLPSDWSTFECRINGMRFLVDVMHYNDEGGRPRAGVFAKTKEGWAIISFYNFDNGVLHPRTKDNTPHSVMIENCQPIIDFIQRQLRAICIALDSDLATTEIIRAPHKLNSQREARGKLPLKDFHIVDLSRRRRLAALPDDYEHTTGTRKRWHYVRGHWRHYESHKTWIKPHFRGDIDLGVIEKEYRV